MKGYEPFIGTWFHVYETHRLVLMSSIAAPHQGMLHQCSVCPDSESWVISATPGSLLLLKVNKYCHMILKTWKL